MPLIPCFNTFNSRLNNFNAHFNSPNLLRGSLLLRVVREKSFTGLKEHPTVYKFDIFKHNFVFKRDTVPCFFEILLYGGSLLL